ncbi:Cytoplasmic FMR1-interacting protein 2 [Lobulomyces angularis]|nr:Cytoplasmic FMR1-interacting protein 2 [Lobulomyces angularis]
MDSSSIIYLNFSDSQIYDADQFYSDPGKSDFKPYKYFLKELGHIATLNDLLSDGKNLVSRLYSYRSCIRGIPQSNAQNNESKEELALQIFEVMKPEISKMKDFMIFRDHAVQCISDVLTSIIPDIKEKDVFSSTEFLLTLATVLDLFVVLDAMKNIKGSMNNDLSIYRRNATQLPRKLAEDDAAQIHKLIIFLGSQDQFSLELKKALAAIPQSDDVLVEVVNACADCLENKRYILSEKKHAYLKAVAFGLYLLDGDIDEKDINKKKKIKLDRLGKLMKSTPIVPLYADSPISLSHIFSKAPHIGQGKWDLTEIEDKGSLQKSYSLSTYSEEFRAIYVEYVANFTQTTICLEAKYLNCASYSNDDSYLIYQLILEGVKFLANCTTKVLEQSAFKYANPISIESNLPMLENAIPYELAVKYNYSLEDKRALIEFLSIIKNLSDLILNLDAKVYEALNSYMYREIQDFAQVNISEFICHATKKKRSIVRVIKVAQEISSDIFLEEKLSNSTTSATKKKFTSELKQRKSPFSLTQLHFLKTYLDYGFSDKSKGMKGGLMKEKDFKDYQVAEVQKFFDFCLYFPCMMDLKGTVEKCVDVSDLWYKEFYLEISKQIQFPISMSLPWILAEYCLDSFNPEMFSNIFVIFDIYNDVAKSTMYNLNSQYIYDEVVAEVNLCFDVLIFKISQRIFSHFKKHASFKLLSADQIEELKNSSDVSKENMLSCFDVILKKKSFDLLGRSINVSEVISQMMNQYIRKSIDIAITRFEGSSLNNIMELHTLLKSTKMTHEMLSELLTLDSFADILAEVDERLALHSNGGRIAQHIIQEFIDDFIPNSAFNSTTNRFVRCAVEFVEPLIRPAQIKFPPMYSFGSKSLTVAFHAQHQVFQNFFGNCHFETILKLTSTNTLSFIVNEIWRHTDILISETLSDYIYAIQKGTPTTLKLPIFEYGAAGAFEYFNAHFKPLIHYKDLKSEVLQTFREIGNSILVVRALQNVANMDCSYKKVRTDSLFNNTSSLSSFMSLKQKYLPDNDLKHLQKDNTLLNQFLKKLKTTLNELNKIWLNPPQLPNSAESENSKDPGSLVDNPRAFYKTWSALQFAFCYTGSDGCVTNREIFGDSLSWAGCTILHCLDQVKLFNTFDYNNHVISVHKAEKKSTNVLNQPVVSMQNPQINSSTNAEFNQFLEVAFFIKDQNEEILDFLEKQDPLNPTSLS